MKNTFSLDDIMNMFFPPVTYIHLPLRINGEPSKMYYRFKKDGGIHRQLLKIGNGELPPYIEIVEKT